MTSHLHPNAALRVLRKEMVRLNDARLELIESLDDIRIPAGLAAQQVQQCDVEIKELVTAHHWLEANWDDAMRAKAAIGIAAE